MFKLNDSYYLKEVDNILYIGNNDDMSIYMLTGSGNDILKLLLAGKTIEDIICLYDVPKEDINILKKEITAFIADLVEEKIMVEI